MKQLFIKNLGFLIFLNILVKPIWMFTEIRVINRVGPEVYGEYFALFGFALLLQVVLDMGISNFNNRNISQHRQLINKYLPNIVVIKILLALLYFALTGIAAVVWNYEWYQLKLIFLLGFNQVLQSYMLYFRSNLAGLRFYKLDSFFSILDRSLAIILVTLLLTEQILPGPFQIEWFIYSQTIALGIAALSITAFVLKQTKKLKVKIKKEFVLLIIKQTYPYALLGVLMSIYTRIDGVMIERMLPDGKDQTGIYGSAYRLLDIGSMYCFVIASLLLPIFSRLLKEKESIKPIVVFCVKLMVIPAIIAAITAYFFSKSIMNQLFYIQATNDYYDVFQYLILCFPAIASQYIFGTLLTANGSLRTLNTISVISLFINITLNYFLIPEMQALGATIATLITQYAVAIAQLFVIHQVFKLSINWKQLARLSILMISTLIINRYCQAIFDFWMINISIVLGASIIIAFILRLLDYQSVLGLLNAKRG